MPGLGVAGADLGQIVAQSSEDFVGGLGPGEGRGLAFQVRTALSGRPLFQAAAVRCAGSNVL
jgi:hypothetical protein